MTSTLLGMHILAGVSAFGAAAVAVLTKSLGISHRWHIYSGRVFFWSALVIFLTAVPLALIKDSLFLLLIAILSFYAALAGWRYATHRTGICRPIDWGSAVTMVIAAVAMFVLSAQLLRQGDSRGITMIVFGTAGGALGVLDLYILRSGQAKGLARIAQHMAMMLTGTTAIVTAFVVTNFTIQRQFVLWIGPALVATPLILTWWLRIRSGKRPHGAADL